MQSVHEIVREAEDSYLTGTQQLGEYVEFSLHDTIERIDAYLNSKHISGPKDSQGRDKPFFNIVTAIVNIWYRATALKMEKIRFQPTSIGSVVLAFVANVLLREWMEENDFGQFLKDWGLSLARYGSSVPKFVEKGDKLHMTVVAWNRLIADGVQFDAIPRIEKLYYTPAQLRKKKNYDQAQVSALILAKTTRKTARGQQKDQKPGFIEVYEVHGELDSRLLKKDPDYTASEEDAEYRQQMHAISYVQKGKEWQDFTLYKGKEKTDPYEITHLLEEDGRSIAIGGVEYAFEAQWMENHTVKNMKDSLDLASRMIFQTADQRFQDRNVLTQIETGDIMVHDPNMPLERIANNSAPIGELLNFGNMWGGLAKELTGTPDAMRGVMGNSAKAYRQAALAVQQSSSLFEEMTDGKTLALKRLMKKYVIPHLKKRLKHRKEIASILDDAGIREIDAMYVPMEAVRRHNKKFLEDVLAGNEPQPFDKDSAEASVRQDIAKQGARRFFVPDEMGEKTWADLLSDFEWDKLDIHAGHDSADSQAVMATLSMVFQTIASNPAVLQDDNARMVFNAILEESGKISPLQLHSTPALPPGQAAPAPGQPPLPQQPTAQAQPQPQPQPAGPMKVPGT